DGEADALTPQLGGIRAADAGAVPRDIDARHRGFAVGIALGQPLAAGGVEMEAALGEIGELRLRPQSEAQSDGVARNRALTATVTIDHRLDGAVALDRAGYDAFLHGDTAHAQPRTIVEALGERARARRERANGTTLDRSTRGVENGG